MFRFLTRGALATALALLPVAGFPQANGASGGIGSGVVSLKAANAAATVAALPAGTSSCAASVTGTWSGTISFEVNDGLQWSAVNVYPANSTSAQTSTTSNGSFNANVAAFGGFRGRMSSYSSGTAVVLIYCSQAVAHTQGGGGGGGGGGVTSVSAGNQVAVTGTDTEPVVGVVASPSFTAVSATNVTASSLTSGDCVQAGTGGILTSAAAACGAGGGGIPTQAGVPTGSGTAGQMLGVTDGGVGRRFFEWVADYTGLPQVVNVGYAVSGSNTSALTVPMERTTTTGDILVGFACQYSNYPSLSAGWSGLYADNGPNAAIYLGYQTVVVPSSSAAPFGVANGYGTLEIVIEVAGASGNPTAGTNGGSFVSLAPAGIPDMLFYVGCQEAFQASPGIASLPPGSTFIYRGTTSGNGHALAAVAFAIPFAAPFYTSDQTDAYFPNVENSMVVDLPAGSTDTNYWSTVDR